MTHHEPCSSATVEAEPYSELMVIAAPAAAVPENTSYGGSSPHEPYFWCALNAACSWAAAPFFEPSFLSCCAARAVLASSVPMLVCAAVPALAVEAEASVSAAGIGA